MISAADEHARVAFLFFDFRLTFLFEGFFEALGIGAVEGWAGAGGINGPEDGIGASPIEEVDGLFFERNGLICPLHPENDVVGFLLVEKRATRFRSEGVFGEGREIVGNEGVEIGGEFPLFAMEDLEGEDEFVGPPAGLISIICSQDTFE